MEPVSPADAVRRAEALAALPGPTLLGITGPPGAGKSTLAAAVVAAVDGAVLVGMDGFHLAHAVLERQGVVAVKGAPHTFDAAGYVALLRRLRDLARCAGDTRGDAHEVVWAPEFRREIEDAVAGAVAVRADHRLVVTEGNYLLLDDGPWLEVRGLLDECWYVDVADDLRRTRLQARHVRYGRTPEQAASHALGSDEANARLVAGTRRLADLVVDGEADPLGSLD